MHQKERYRKLRELKKDDYIEIQFGNRIHKAVVLRNYPYDGKVYIQVTRVKKVLNYNDYNFDLSFSEWQ